MTLLALSVKWDKWGKLHVLEEDMTAVEGKVFS